MKRILPLLTAGLLVLGLAGCGKDSESQAGTESAESGFKPVTWKMVTTWPKNFPGLGTVPEQFAKDVEVMSGGRLKIKVYGAGEMVPALQTFDTVKSGAAQIGHGAAYYWKGKVPAAQIFTALPFGMNAQEINSWFYYGGGLELWQQAYQPFGLIPLPGGNTGVQMAGWFRKEINSVEDFNGLKMRIPGLAGEVITELGAIPVSLPGGEIFSSMQSGAIDATDWVGPYNDQAFGLYKVAPYYYVTGWQEAGAAMEFIINEAAFNGLPEDLQRIVEVAAEKTNANMLALYTSENNKALQSLINEHGVQIKQFPPEVVSALQTASKKVIAEMVASDPQTAKIYQSYKTFLSRVTQYHELTELNYYQNRQGVELP
ncbi:TRAP transporter substrate-binding protein [Catenovulum sp. 2E275]|uniref:TRAP transporter substrate-binding protein n=1 Tax=Catenovulum sp. 2E275 TaxID=2980497 RepID=UPI0021D062D7|nr:TRAP transporter substrate-binding protein [Catenovulum sp. 2E275]MCU4674907.1 TRAP transporter substrate-binding protein [Catenovulum sp. 2E275]